MRAFHPKPNLILAYEYNIEQDALSYCCICVFGGVRTFTVSSCERQYEMRVCSSRCGSLESPS